MLSLEKAQKNSTSKPQVEEETTAGSWFFLGELYTDLPLPTTGPAKDHCGSCTRCIDACPTGALDTPYQLDARQCIAYLTIEHKSSIPEPLRPLIGNRIFGCDDCQSFCPWNKFLKITDEADFKPRHNLDDIDLSNLFMWSEEEFLKKTQGSPIRRAGYESWLRNIAIALGNAESSVEVLRVLHSKKDDPSEIVKEHVNWAIQEQLRKSNE